MILINVTGLSAGLLQSPCMLLLNDSPLRLCRWHKWTRSWTSSRTCCIIWFPVSRGIRATTDHLREATTTSVQSFSSPTTPCPPTSSWQYREETRTTYPDVVRVWVGFFLLFSSKWDWVLRTWEKWSSSANQEIVQLLYLHHWSQRCSSKVTHNSQRIARLSSTRQNFWKLHADFVPEQMISACYFSKRPKWCKDRQNGKDLELL